MKLFHWGLILRYALYGALPLVALFIILERSVGEGWSSVAIIWLALALPFIAVGWLGYQHWKHRRRRHPGAL